MINERNCHRSSVIFLWTGSWYIISLCLPTCQPWYMWCNINMLCLFYCLIIPLSMMHFNIISDLKIKNLKCKICHVIKLSIQWNNYISKTQQYSVKHAVTMKKTLNNTLILPCRGLSYSDHAQWDLNHIASRTYILKCIAHCFDHRESFNNIYPYSLQGNSHTFKMCQQLPWYT